MSSTYEYFEKMCRPELKAAGTHFFCEACLIHKPKGDKSADPRYCQGCFDFLSEEAAMQPTRRAPWMPRTAKIPPEKGSKVSYPIARVLSHINDQNIHKCQNTPAAGRPQLDLPIERIKDLVAQGAGATEIMRELKSQGIKVSRRTLYRAIEKSATGEQGSE